MSESADFILATVVRHPGVVEMAMGIFALLGVVALPTAFFVALIYVTRGDPHRRPPNRLTALGAWQRFGQCSAQLFHVSARAFTATTAIWCTALLLNDNDVTPSVALCVVAVMAVFFEFMPRSLPEVACGIAWRVTAAAILFCCLVPFEFSFSRDVGDKQNWHVKRNVKNVMVELANFHDQHNQLPPAASAELMPRQRAWPPWNPRKPGPNRPQHSWRTSVAVSGMQRQGLGRPNYDANQPWDSKMNLAFATRAGELFETGRHEHNTARMTGIVSVVGPDTIWDTTHGPVQFGHITDGSANTVAVIYSPKMSMPWTEPRDIRVTWDDPAIDLNTGKRWLPTNDDAGVFVGFLDGSVRWVPNNLSPRVWKAMLTRNGGEVIDLDQEIRKAEGAWWAAQPLNRRARRKMKGLEFYLGLTAWSVLVIEVVLTGRSRRITPRNRRTSTTAPVGSS